MSNNMAVYTHPFNDVQILDQSAGEEVRSLDLPLHKPLVFLRAAKGRGEPYWCTGTEAIAEYGEQTFDKYEKFYRSEQLFLYNAFFPNQAAWVYRVIPDDAKVASVVIECVVTKGVQITQYKRDDNGNFIYDESGEKIPETDASGATITETGIKLSYTKRALTDEELANNEVQERTVELSDGTTFTTVPIVHAIYRDACAEGNRSGFQLFVDYNNQSSDLVDATESLLWTFVPMQQPYNSNIANVIVDIYSSTSNTMTMKQNTLDPYTQRRMHASDVIDRLYYKTSTKQNLLPYDMVFYSDNIKKIGDTVVEYETNNPDLKDGWYVDILTLLDKDGNPYHHAEIDTADPDCIQMSNLYTHYLEGGDDGDISDEKFEEQIQQILKLKKFPQLIDYFKYPITHLYDVGYTLETKFAMTDFMATQKRCKIEVAAQDINRHLYSMDEAVSLAAALRARCSITPESTYYGTPAMRASIFGQSGYINDTSIKSIVPMTYWMALKRAQYHNSTRIGGTWTEYPNNVVDIYRKDNFTPYNPDQKELLWDGAANYYQYATMTDKFIPSIRTIYKTQSSMLADQEFADACVYLMYICDFVWVLHCGKTGYPFAKMKSIIQEDIEKYAYRAFGDRYPVSATVYVTKEDVSRKDSLHIDTVLTGYRPFRRWFNTIIARGEENNATESAEI